MFSPKMKPESPTMKIRTSLFIQFLMLLAMCVLSGIYCFRLSDPTPTHWNIQGQVDQYGSKWQIVLMGPCLILFSMLLTVALPKMSPKKYEIDTFASTYAYAMVLIAALFMFIGIIILRSSAGSNMWTRGTFMGGMFLFFALLGNVLGKVQQNFFLGIRTPWTLASTRVWDATHRFAGRLWLVGGSIGAILAFAGLPMAGSITLLLIIAFIPVVQSYFLYQKLER